MSFQDKIRDSKCELCPLNDGAQHVCLMGSGTRKAKLMIIGEAPGEREDATHQAFVGPSGQLLTELLHEVQIARKDCYITNVAKCRPPSNRTPDRKEIKTCVENYLWAEWDKVRPDVVLVLGNAALQGVLGKSGITKHRGSPVQFRGATVLPAFHPAYALRNPRMLPALQADIHRLRRLIDGSESPAGRTRIKSIRTKENLRWLAKRLRHAEEYSFDIETNLNKEEKRYYEYWEEGFRLVSLSISFEEGTSYVIPLWHAESPWKDPQSVLRYLRPYLEGGVGRGDPSSNGIPIVLARTNAHNGKFDVQGLASFGIHIRLTFDTMLAAHMLDENRPKGLKPLSEIDLAVDGYAISKDDRKIDYTNLPWHQVAVYNGKDTDYTLRLRGLYWKALCGPSARRTLRVFAKLMMPASDMLVKVERRGIWIDPERLEERTRIAQRNLAKIRGYISETGGAGAINLNSPQQVARWLFGDKKEGGLELPIIESTDKGAPSTREAVILRLAREYPPVRALLLYRKWAKYESTYLRPWAARRDSKSRYHTSYKLFGTVTGRLSGDFQQVPRDSFIRSIVGAPPGWKMVTADFSQIELRIAAMLADERNMLRVFHEGGDLHLATAVNVSGLREADITAELRKKAKPVNFGFLYGMGWRKFIAYAFENYGVIFTDEEAQSVRRRFFESYPSLLRWHDRQRRIVHEYGMVYSPLGRARHLPDVYSQDKGVAAESERQAINSPVQSCASDLMLMSMLLLEPQLRSNSAFIIGTVHDEILFQVRDEALPEVCPLIQRTMESDVLVAVRKKFGTEITVPIEAEVSYGQHWDKMEMKTWDVTK